MKGSVKVDPAEFLTTTELVEALRSRFASFVFAGVAVDHKAQDSSFYFDRSGTLVIQRGLVSNLDAMTRMHEGAALGPIVQRQIERENEEDDDEDGVTTRF